MYYSYNQEKKSYEFYSQVTLNTATNMSTDNQSWTDSVSCAENKDCEQRYVLNIADTTTIDMVETGSEDGEIIEVNVSEIDTKGIVNFMDGAGFYLWYFFAENDVISVVVLCSFLCWSMALFV